MNKTRVEKLENESKKNSPHVPPKSVTLDDGKLLTEGKDGNLYYENGTVFYDRKAVADGLIGLIVRKFV